MASSPSAARQPLSYKPTAGRSAQIEREKKALAAKRAAPGRYHP
jgi:hypothetical protein